MIPRPPSWGFSSHEIAHYFLNVVQNAADNDIIIDFPIWARAFQMIQEPPNWA